MCPFFFVLLFGWGDKKVYLEQINLKDSTIIENKTPNHTISLNPDILQFAFFQQISFQLCKNWYYMNKQQTA